MIEYVEPDEDDNCVLVSITKEEAIKRQREIANLSGHIYDTDEQALYDFMSVHWAKDTGG